MALTDTACRNAKPREKDWKLADSKGLFLLVRPAGGKLWRLKFRYHGMEKQLAFGGYPDVSLKEARDHRDAARRLLAQGSDPSAEKKHRKVQAAIAALDSFERVARAWHAVKALSLAPRYADQVMERLVNHVFPRFGSIPIREVTPALVLDAIRAVEKRGTLETAHRVRMHTSDIFVWSIASGLADHDPAAIIRKALQPVNAKLRPARLKLDEMRAVLAKTEATKDAWWATLLASRLLALTAARPGVVRHAERQEFEGLDGAEPLWRIPAAKMKLSRERKRDASFEFVIPLSHQAAEVVAVAMRTSRDPRLLFPGLGRKNVPIGNSTLTKHYRDAGLVGLHVPHGWRASFSTLMNERAARENRESDRAIIDMMLAHVSSGVEAAYNRAAYMPRRRELAQAWADLLMEGRAPAEDLVPEVLRS